MRKKNICVVNDGVAKGTILYLVSAGKKVYTNNGIFVSTKAIEWGKGMTGLINLMEETVLKKIDQLWPGTNYCKCEQCRMDIATYALNRLPAQYVQSLKGKVLYRFESNSMQRDIEVTVAVGQGIEIVGKSPHKNVKADTDEAATASAAANANAAGGGQ